MSSLFARDDTQEDWGRITITITDGDGVKKPAMDIIGFDLSGSIVTDPPYGNFESYDRFKSKYVIGSHRTFADDSRKVDFVGPKTRDALAFWNKLTDNTGP